MKRTILSVALALMAGAPAMAQLSQGNPSAVEFKTGNRAQKGDFGIYLGITSSSFTTKSAFESEKYSKASPFKINPLPLINLKYMVTDRVEARLGLEFYKVRETLKGDQYIGDPYADDAETADTKHKVVKADNRILPGVAYHFSKHNIIDVYAGAEALIGWNRDSEWNNVDDSETSHRRCSFQLGAGAFIGLQAYVGNLPLAIGVEYGLSTLWETHLRYKETSKDADGHEQTVCTADNDQLRLITSSDQYENLKASRGSIGNKFAVTLTYFFK